MTITTTKVDSPIGKIDVYTITNSSGARVVLSSLGAGILQVWVPDAHGRIENVALGYENPADYYHDGPCMGKTPGRYANRIGAGKFIIDGNEYSLAINNGPNALHGGPEGFHQRLWHSRVIGDDTVEFSRLSPDGEEGYPGNLQARVTYRWTDDNNLIINYHATTDKPTVVNLTNHAYWNLRAENAGCALNHFLTLNADRYLVADESLLPTGEIAPVDSTPMDFRTEKRISADFNKPFPALVNGHGYDSCWLINRPEGDHSELLAATLRCEITGRALNVFTTLPGVQVYSGNWLTGCPKSVSGGEYQSYDGIAIECQHCPDAPNKQHFPSAVLRPGEVFDETIRFEFRTQPDN